MISVVKFSVWVYSLAVSSNYFARYKVYEFKKYFYDILTAIWVTITYSARADLMIRLRR